MDRRAFFLSAAGLVALPLDGRSQAPSSRLGVMGEAYFTEWLDGFYARALDAGVPQTLLDRSLAGLSPDPRVVALDARQPEFARPISQYIMGAVNAQRIALGRAKRAAIPQFPEIERAWGVPRDILIAIWAMETNFGVQMGGMDIIRCLASLAALGRRRPWAEHELISAFRMLQQGDVSRERLKGSWAGAMGQTQMLPSTYLELAVDGDGDGRRDIWGSAPDALASAAHLLAKSGWTRDQDWAREVRLPAGFDYGLSEGPTEIPSWWRERGVVRADGRGWTHTDAEAPCVLLLPAGAAGPALLALPNHFVIRKYNNSLAYALAVGLLADGFAGGGGLIRPWPAETPLSLNDRMAAQAALAKAGYSPGTPDGVIGLGTRQALRAWQKANGLPADGYLSRQMVARLTGGAPSH